MLFHFVRYFMYLFWHSNFPSIKHSSWQKHDGIFGTTNGSGAGGGREKLAAMSEVGCLNWVTHSNVLSLAMHLILSGPKVLSALRDQQKLGKSLPSSPC